MTLSRAQLRLYHCSVLLLKVIGDLTSNKTKSEILVNICGATLSGASLSFPWNGAVFVKVPQHCLFIFQKHEFPSTNLWPTPKTPAALRFFCSCEGSQIRCVFRISIFDVSFHTPWALESPKVASQLYILKLSLHALWPYRIAHVIWAPSCRHRFVPLGPGTQPAHNWICQGIASLHTSLCLVLCSVLLCVMQSVLNWCLK